MEQDKKKYLIAYSELLNRCWEDPDYLAKFRENPAAALEDFGIPTVPGARYHIVPSEEMKQSTMEDIYLPYTEKPKMAKLSADDLNLVAGGGIFVTKSNVIVNQNAVADGTIGAESVAIAVTIAVEVAVG